MTQFKVGDLVRNIHAPTLVSKIIDIKAGCIILLKNGYEHPINDYCLELWKPREGEWCWFWNKNSLDDYPRIGKYGNMSWSLEYWDYCEPFIGQLPSFLKEN